MSTKVKLASIVGILAAVVASTSGRALADVQTAASSVENAAHDLSDNDTDVAALIDDLGSQRYVDRQRAQQQLIRIGVEAFDQIRAAMSHPDPEVASAAEHILGEIAIPWTTPDDSPAIQTELRDFSTYSDVQRLRKVRLLANTSEPDATRALCRIVRFDVSEFVSRSAALAIVDSHDSESQPPRELDSELANDIGNSGRRGAAWVRLYAQELKKPAATAEQWQREFESQIEEYRLLAEQLQSEGASADDQWMADELAQLPMGWGLDGFQDLESPRIALAASSQIVIDLGWHLFRLQKQLDQVNSALATLDRIIEHDPEQFDPWAIEAIDWLADRQEWDALDQFLDKHDQRLATTRRAQYTAAIARRQQGNNERAEQLAERALHQPVDNPLERIFDASDFLLRRQQWKWAENEYRQIIATEPMESQWSLYSRFRLADLLYDSEKYAAAAAELEGLETRIEEDEQFRKSYNQVREAFLMRGVHLALPKELSAQRHFYLACQAHQEQDTDEERAHLVTSFERDASNPDVLIAMYRADPDNTAWQYEVRQRIRDYCQKVDAEIQNLEATRDRLRANAETRDNSIEELRQNYNQWAWLVSNTEGDFEKAIQYSKKSLELAPNAAGYLDTLARCYYAAGDYENAVKHQRKAVELEPSMQVMQRQLALFEIALAEGDGR